MSWFPNRLTVSSSTSLKRKNMASGNLRSPQPSRERGCASLWPPDSAWPPGPTPPPFYRCACAKGLSRTRGHGNLVHLPRNPTKSEISEISGNLCAHARNPEISRNLGGNLREIQKSLGISRNLIEIFWRISRAIVFAAARNTKLSLLDSRHVSEEKANVLLGLRYGILGLSARNRFM